jgi:CTP synthase
LDLAKQGVDEKVLKLLDLPVHNLDMSEWNAMLAKLMDENNKEVEIAVVGKYISLRDSYKSIYEALAHGAIAGNVNLKIRMLESEEITPDNVEQKLAGVQGVLVPGGFGIRGVEGKICAIRYARENKIPFFGICLGMQCAVIEFLRNVCGLQDANSTEVEPGAADPVISLLDEQRGITDMGGTMRLGAYPCTLTEGTISAGVYRKSDISERHRHRYEFNPHYRELIEKNGVVIAGKSPDGALVEMIELPEHPWFVACQFHPEFKSTPVKPHPLFASFVAAAASRS